MKPTKRLSAAECMNEVRMHPTMLAQQKNEHEKSHHENFFLLVVCFAAAASLVCGAEQNCRVKSEERERKKNRRKIEIQSNWYKVDEFFPVLKCGEVLQRGDRSEARAFPVFFHRFAALLRGFISLDASSECFSSSLSLELSAISDNDPTAAHKRLTCNCILMNYHGKLLRFYDMHEALTVVFFLREISF